MSISCFISLETHKKKEKIPVQLSNFPVLGSANFALSGIGISTPVLRPTPKAGSIASQMTEIHQIGIPAT